MITANKRLATTDDGKLKKKKFEQNLISVPLG